ncbi:MAG: hypothetical protein JXR64_08475, partial [Spirochaetales bacterium]|nr:hypothetical protein [Spirochaetales bacterium]
MELKFNQLHEILKESEKAAVEAGNIIMNFKTGGFERLEKISGSSLASNTLTNADLYSQKAILKILNPIIVKFDLGLLAEESLDDNSRLIKDYFFAIDPLDGTKSFIEKDYGFAVSIALVSREGYPIIGVVYNPVNKNLYTSIKGHRLFRNGLELKKTPSLGNKKIIVDPGNKLNPVNGFEYVQYGGAVVNAISV